MPFVWLKSVTFAVCLGYDSTDPFTQKGKDIKSVEKRKKKHQSDDIKMVSGLFMCAVLILKRGKRLRTGGIIRPNGNTVKKTLKKVLYINMYGKFGRRLHKRKQIKDEITR